MLFSFHVSQSDNTSDNICDPQNPFPKTGHILKLNCLDLVCKFHENKTSLK